MIFAIIFFVYFLWLSAVYGFAVQSIWVRLVERKSRSTLPMPIVSMIGLCALSVVASVFNLFFPLGLLYIVLVSVGAIILHVRLRPFRPKEFFAFSSSGWILIAAISLTVLVLTTLRPSVSDTALYHAQTIRWFEEYPAVPGLANLHHRLAFNSSWLVVNAAFSFAFTGLQSFHLVSGFFFLLALLYFVWGVDDLVKGKLTWHGMFKILAIPLSFYLFSAVISSPAYDMPAALLIWVLAILWLEGVEDQSKWEDFAPVIFLFSVFAVTVKLSALPLLLFPIWILFYQARQREWKKVAAFGALAFVVLIPWMIRSVIFSGYLVFPVSELDLFSFDWKFPSEQVSEIRDGIVGFARQPGKDWREAVSMTFSEWFPLWYGDLTLNQKIIFLLALFSPLLLALGKLISSALLSPRLVWVFLTLYAGVFYWFLTAPDIRFGYGFLVGADILTASFFLLIFFQRLNRIQPQVNWLVFSGLVLYLAFMLASSIDASTLSERIVQPLEYARSRALPCDISNGSVFCRVEGGQCNYETFPCIPSPRPNVEMRGATFRDGFRSSGSNPGLDALPTP